MPVSLEFLRKAINPPERTISILALVVALASAFFSYLQSRNSAQQILLNAQQLRPHVTYVPTFFPTKEGLRIDMYLQNHSPLPAHVLFTDVAGAVDGQVQGPHFYSKGPDIIHQGRDGGSTLPIVPKKTLAAVVDGKSTLFVATCAVYASTAASDRRRWIVKAINEFLSGSSLPSRHWIDEQEVQLTVETCDAKVVFAEHPIR